MSIKIEDFCTYAPKSDIKAGEASLDGQYMFFTSSEDESKRYTDYQFDGEGIIMGTGGNATLHYYNGKYAVSTDCIVLIPDNRVRCKYLYYFFLANMYVLEAGFKGAGLKHTNKKYIGSIELASLPTLQVQDSVIEILDKVSAVIKARRLELSALDDLVKARFVEMFGNNKYPITRLGSVCVKITDGTHKTPTYLSDGVTFISAKNIVNDEIDLSDIKYISLDEYKEIQKRCQTEINDILISKSGSLGTAAIIRTNKPLGLFESLAVIKYDRNKLTPEFLCEQLKSHQIQKQFAIGKKGVAVKHLHLNVISNISVIVPPLNIQKRFTTFVVKVKKAKDIIQKSIDKYQILYDSLMQKYFG